MINANFKNVSTAIIIVLLIIAAVGASYLVYSSKYLDISEKISNIILLFTCLAGFLAIIFFILNYFIVKDAFIKSLEPALLLVVVPEIINTANGPNTTKNTIIHYENPTNNTFFDLCIFCKIFLEHDEIDYSHIFSQNMYMGPHDGRNRKFNFIDDLKNMGYDIQDLYSSRGDILLKLSFSYTFLGNLKKYSVQDYKWDFKTNTWEIV